MGGEEERGDGDEEQEGEDEQGWKEDGVDRAGREILTSFGLLRGEEAFSRQKVHLLLFREGAGQADDSQYNRVNYQHHLKGPSVRRGRDTDLHENERHETHFAPFECAINRESRDGTCDFYFRAGIESITEDNQSEHERGRVAVVEDEGQHEEVVRQGQQHRQFCQDL